MGQSRRLQAPMAEMALWQDMSGARRPEAFRPDQAQGVAASGWLILSDQAFPPPEAGPTDLPQGALICELALPLPGPGILLDLRGSDSAFSLFLDHEAGLGLVLRQGAQVLRARLPGPLPRGTGVARITWAWDAPADRWALRYEQPGLPGVTEATGSGALPLALPDLDRLCRNGPGTLRHEALLWFGATAGQGLPAHAPWIGQRTPIATPTGLRPAGSLAAGDMILTSTGRAAALRSVRHLVLPSRGYHAPVLLRAPYFSPQRDILVSADQPVLLTGGEVEYLIDTDEVLVAARHIADGRAALFETRRPVAGTVSLDIGPPDLIASDGLAFLSASHGGPAPKPPRPLLHSYEAVPLLLLLGRAGGGRLR